MAVRLLAVVALLGVAVVGCGETACSPCRPGTHASNPTESCSTCIPSDGGADARRDGATTSVSF